MFVFGSATSHKTLSDQIRDIAINRHVATAVINAGGTLYAADDILTVAIGGGAVAHGLNATIRVLTVDGGGVILTARMETHGAYTTDPTVLTANAVTGGTGTLATFDLTMAETGWTLLIDDTTFGANNDYRVMLEGANGGVAGDEVYVGMHTNQSGTAPNDFYNIRPYAFTGYNSLLDFADQPGTFASPYMNAQNDGTYPILYWVQITDRHITVVCKPEDAAFTTYASMSMGLLDPYATQSEFPYPIYVSANSPRNVGFNTTNANEQGAISSICELVNYRDTNYPMYLRDAAGTWQAISNKQFNSSLSTLTKTDRITHPLASPTVTSLGPADEIVDADFSGIYMTRISMGTTGTDAAPLYTLQPTPGTPDDQRIMWPLVVIFGPAVGDDIIGEIPGLFWTIGGGVSSEDTIVDANGDRYRIFLGGRRTQIYSWFAIKEA